MEVDVLQLVVQGGALALLAVVLFVFARYFLKPLLDDFRASHAENVRVLVEVATNLEAISKKLNGVGEQGECVGAMSQVQELHVEEMRDAQLEIVAALRAIQKQGEQHDARAREWHKQRLSQSDEQHRQQLAQGAELLDALRAHNGKC